MQQNDFYELVLDYYSIFNNLASGRLTAQTSSFLLTGAPPPRPRRTPAASAHPSGAISFNTITATTNFQFSRSSNRKLALDSFLSLKVSAVPPAFRPR